MSISLLVHSVTLAPPARHVASNATRLSLARSGEAASCDVASASSEGRRDTFDLVDSRATFRVDIGLNVGVIGSYYGPY